MPFQAEALLSYRIPDVVQDLTPKDCILYALGIGIGGDPLDGNALRFVYEKDLDVLPSMASVLAHPRFWMKKPDTGVNWRLVVHAQQSVTLRKKLRPYGKFRGRSRVIGVEDKGPEKGALVFVSREICSAASGEVVAESVQTIYCRGDGGAGNAGLRVPAVPKPLDRSPDAQHEILTMPQQALIYRLSGDLNPLHADPAVAREAGYPRPILHGLATFGIAAYAIVTTAADFAAERLTMLTARFTSAVFPGERLVTDIWTTPSGGHYMVRAAERNDIAVSYGTFTLTDCG